MDRKKPIRSAISGSSLINNTDLENSDFLNESKINQLQEKTKQLSQLKERNGFLERKNSELLGVVADKEAEIKGYEDKLLEIKNDFDGFRIKSAKIASAAERYKEELEDCKANMKRLETESYEVLKMIKSKYDKRLADMKFRYEQQIAELKQELKENELKQTGAVPQSTTSVSPETGDDWGTTQPKRAHSPSGSKSKSQQTANDTERHTPVPPAEKKKREVKNDDWSPASESPRSQASWGVDASTSCSSLPLREQSKSTERSDNASSPDFDRLASLQKSLNQKNDELTMMKIENRCADRKLKRNEETLEMLRERNTDYRKKIAEMENQLEELREELGSKTKLLDDFKQTKKSTEDNLNSKISKHENERIELEEKIKRLEEKCKAFREVESGMASWKQKYDECRKDMELMTNTTRRLRSENDRLTAELKAFKDKMATKEHEHKKLNRNHEVLKTVSSEMNKQVEKYKEVVDNLMKEKDESQQEVIQVKRSLEILATKLARSKADAQAVAKKHEEDLDAKEDELIRLRAELELERIKLNKLHETIAVERERGEEHSGRISELEQELEYKEQLITDMDSHLSQMHSQLVTVKEEAAKNITALTQIKIHNERLMEALQEGANEQRNLEEVRSILNAQIESLRDQHRSEKIRLEETTQQQNKVIRFLQSQPKQKKSKFGFFGSILTPKGPRHPSEQPPARDVAREAALERENKRLAELLERYKGQIADHKAREHELASDLQVAREQLQEYDELERISNRPFNPTQFPLMDSLRHRTTSDYGRVVKELREVERTSKQQDGHKHASKSKAPVAAPRRSSKPINADEEEFTFSDSLIADLESQEDEDAPTYPTTMNANHRYSSRTSHRRI